MASEDVVAIRVRMDGAAETVRDEQAIRRGMQDIAGSARGAAEAARTMGGAVDGAIGHARRSLRTLSYALPGGLGGTGLIGAALFGTGAVVKQGLAFNAQVESAQLRFQNFTSDAKGLYNQVEAINKASRFNLSNLTAAAALLGNMGVRARDVPRVLQGIANAAAASGGGDQALNSIALAVGQIQARGKLAQQEVNQLTQAGAPNVMQTLTKGFGLTAKQIGNLGGSGLSARKAINLLVKDWTSGQLAKAAGRDAHSLAGQWALLTDNIQEAEGAATKGLAGALEHNVLPQANKAAAAITQIFGTKGLSDAEKIRRAREAIRTNLGPVWDEVKHDIDQADIPGHLGQLVGKAIPVMAAASFKAGGAAAGAFVKAWLHSGAWTQIATLLFLGGKTGLLGKLGRGALGKLGVGGKAAGGIVGALEGARGMTPANPLFVHNVGMPTGPVSKVPGSNTVGRVAAKVGRYAMTGGVVAAPIVFGAGAVVAISEGPQHLPAGQRNVVRDPVLRGGRGGPAPAAANSYPVPAAVVSDRQATQALNRYHGHMRARH